MKNHLTELKKYIPDLHKRRILDLGSGTGKFVVSVAEQGGAIIGVEPYREYVEQSRDVIRAEDLNTEIIQADGENLPFADFYFGFVNMDGVIEHVNDPKTVLKEVYRVLGEDAYAYISVPNRHGFKDQHFNLYFVNWLPRFLANPFISLFHKHKNYKNTPGRQKLNEMYYYRYDQALKLFKEADFKVIDIRKRNINRIIYRLLRPWYFSTYEFILQK